MKFKCIKCKHINEYIKCHMCKALFSTETSNMPVLCPKCEEECEMLYIETINNKHKQEEEKRKKQETIYNMPLKYKSLLIDFDG